MPAFILISGYFSKKVYQPGYISKLVKKLIIPYALLQFNFLESPFIWFWEN
ncbi:hypothetical protein RhiirA1_481416 [Rhizophagus irregularis]|uniref:Uncharacterized protein n=1 Tax=Rhizophagus irregularis TaxID=588596 RepID=A0A2N0QN56_9GLOM|nr:hypothetical protein RhiirA1_481416 [Rhizophagus irregularis]